jgi:hypothetical protein
MESRVNTMKEVLIKIHYTSAAGRSERKGSFPLRGQRPEEVALDWWEKDVSRGVEKKLDKITVDGVDITEKVLEVRKERWNQLGLPF